jgi:hypothetical protein
MSDPKLEKKTGKRSQSQQQNVGSHARRNSGVTSGTLADVNPEAATRAVNASALETESGAAGANMRFGDPTPEEIAARAYRCWHERGCPHGSPDIDWTRAEQELRTERQGKSAAAALG